MYYINPKQLNEQIAQWFKEDIGDGDHTSLSSIPADAEGCQQLIIKEDGIIAGVEVGEQVIRFFDPTLRIERFINDGSQVKKGDIVFKVYGKVRSLLQVERTMLNIMQRMSGIATTAHRYQKLLEGTSCRVLDTRKTTPGLRLLEKEAVRIGGGTNHRIGLYDMILLKDNHVDFAGGTANAINRAYQYCIDNKKDLKIEIEVRNLDELEQALATGKVDRIMFDNFTPEKTKEAVKIVKQWEAQTGRYVETESSGGITQETIRDYALSGVDFVSVGALTHSFKSLDMSFKAVK